MVMGRGALWHASYIPSFEVGWPRQMATKALIHPETLDAQTDERVLRRAAFLELTSYESRLS
jgi:hypothetical protein